MFTQPLINCMFYTEQLKPYFLPASRNDLSIPPWLSQSDRPHDLNILVHPIRTSKCVVVQWGLLLRCHWLAPLQWLSQVLSSFALGWLAVYCSAGNACVHHVQYLLDFPLFYTCVFRATTNPSSRSLWLFGGLVRERKKEAVTLLKQL